MPIRDGSTMRGARPTATAPESAETLAENTTTETTLAPTLTRIWSLTGVGYVDERFGVSFVYQPFADVTPELAAKMAAFRPDRVDQDEFGQDVIVEGGGEPLYSTTEPAAPVVDNP